jgi:hypothetical protein
MSLSGVSRHVGDRASGSTPNRRDPPLEQEPRMTRLRKTVRVTTLVGSLAVVGCSFMHDELELLRGIAAEFQAPESSVSAPKNGVLKVTLQNSPLAESPGGDQQRVCRLVAEYVRDHYRRYADLKGVQVVVVARGAIGPVGITTKGKPCTLSVSDLGAASSKPGGALSTSAPTH